MAAQAQEVAAAKLSRYWSTSYFPALDGLRAFCVLMVIFNHTHVRVPPGIPTWVGVDIFFVLSGFLITTLLLRERETYGNVTLKGFYTRRIFRILPVYFVVLFSYIPILFVLHDSKRWQDYKHALPYLISFTQEFRPSTYGTIFGHTWSLGYEEKFYMVWPLLLLLLYPLRGRNLGIVVAIGAALLLLPPQASRSYGGLFLGALLAILLDKQCPNPLQGPLTKIPATAALITLVASFELLSLNTHLILIFSACATLLTAALVLNTSWLSRLFAHPAIVLLGKRSYAMYLVHVLFLDATEKVAHRIHAEVWYFVVPITFLLSFLGATALFYLVERPCIDRGRRLSKGMRKRLQGTGNLRNHMVEQGMPVIERQDEGTSRAY